MWEILHPKGYFEIFNIKYNGQIIAAALFLLFNKKITCACATSETKNLRLRPNNFLFWKVLEWAYENNYVILDLGMTRLDGGGLIFFKKSFNTNDTLYGHQYFPKNVISFEDTIVSKLGRISIKLFPIGLMKYAGPYLTSKFG
jgi:lipid II:glycine glycyltransferase (peptidoglycan interpeptide bridge formation enzyme)